MKRALVLVVLVLAGIVGCASTPPGYYEGGRHHDHAATAAMATICLCGETCDRATVCCGPSHCVCRPN